MGLVTAHRMDGWTLLFLATTVATSVTGFGFPWQGFTPAIGVGIVSMILLAAAIVGRYVFQLTGHRHQAASRPTPGYAPGRRKAVRLCSLVLAAFLVAGPLSALAQC
jgi:hypothetical protein